MAGAGAFDSIEPDRAGVFAAAETILAVAQRTQDSRTSGQGGLFGEAERGGGAIQLPTSVHWSLVNRINAEREAFGFYFSAHPLDRFEHLAQVYGARAIATLGEVPVAEGARVGATIAALVEDARWRTSARGNRYLMATLSDTSGQVPVTCFEEPVAKELEDLSRDGGCAVLTVELDRRAGRRDRARHRQARAAVRIRWRARRGSSSTWRSTTRRCCRCSRASSAASAAGGARCVSARRWARARPS